jgi:hypothetical protein
MRDRLLRSIFTIAVTCISWAVSATAFAAPDLAYLTKQLQTAEDFRVRTQAALALGSTGDAGAVQPLCKALGDSNASVKGASAAALGKLGKPEGLPCLKAAKAKESDRSLLATIDQSIDKLSSGVPEPPPPGPDAKYYVAIEVKNKSSRSNPDVERIVRAAIQKKLLEKKEYAVAPRTETVAQGKAVVGAKKLKGYMLMASVEPFKYEGGKLTVQVRVAMLTYHDKALKAEFAPKLTQDQTPSADPEGEKVLMQMASETAVSNFEKVAASL